MCSDFMLDTEIVLCPIIREKDGLALSSRNVNLSQKDRSLAILIIQAMKQIEKSFHEGETNCFELIQKGKEILAVPGLDIEYLDIVDSDDLESLQKISNMARIMIAVNIGSVRLIDNLSLEL